MTLKLHTFKSDTALSHCVSVNCNSRYAGLSCNSKDALEETLCLFSAEGTLKMTNMCCRVPSGKAMKRCTHTDIMLFCY